MVIEVSVIIPFYKNKEWLVEAIDSVMAQTLANYEIIVVIDGSDEDTAAIEQRYSQVKFYKIKNSGPGRARNYGINLASGKYTAFLDADDLWTPDKLASQVAFMERSNLIWSHCNYIKFWEDRESTKNVNCKMEGSIIPRMFLTCPIATPCVMIRTSVLKENINLRFAENIRAGEDSYFWFKLAELYSLGFINEYTTKVRMRGSNAASQAYVQLKSRAENYEFIKKEGVYFKNKVYYFFVKSGFLMCKCGYYMVNFLTRNFKLSSGFREILSKSFYIIPYLYLKILSLKNSS